LDRRERIGLLRDLLLARDWDGVNAFPAPPGWLLRRLLSALQDPSPCLRWRAVAALGHVAGSLPSGDPALTEFVRSLFWSMNDESGNLCRMAPEALGEILRARPELRAPFAHLLPQYLVEEPFETGALWALCRLADAGWCPGPLPSDLLSPSLDHPDPRRRGLARRLRSYLSA
jgi:hypothetical protein